ncbi:DNA-processing protein DprA [Virgibacillus halodenitrificans]|uniref:DNA-processing protein DprA n=1 Tax=Virgibacillus halodenitrificans TaxID=1482 RepID=UPI0024BF1B21|nr:DNA-processing protein DprA [Virgibacillus halodenitrificans]WHX27149.1 DNA-processing protein DprA [Virgibacillus halodenitrificans]
MNNIYHLSPAALAQHYALTPKASNYFYNDLRSNTIFNQLTVYLKEYNILTIFDKVYPPLLKHIPDAPLVLYAAGDVTLLHQTPSLSVVGTRHPSIEGKNKTKWMLEELIELGWIIISGMAAGIDSHAHYLSLNNNGKTIAVLGGGFKHIYPRHNIPLFNDITKRGLVLSEYPPHLPPQRYHFPERNRIISGLSFGTLVIEAKERSGTLITVDQALEQGREVFAVPGSPFIPQTEGCHKMIQEGAMLVKSPQDIIEEWYEHGHNLSNLQSTNPQSKFSHL